DKTRLVSYIKESSAISSWEGFTSFLFILALLVHLVLDGNFRHPKELFWIYALRVRISQQQRRPF
ncbi:MAG: hypothetical protein WB818_00845, partial [Desulfobacterales bacterium]